VKRVSFLGTGTPLANVSKMHALSKRRLVSAAGTAAMTVGLFVVPTSLANAAHSSSVSLATQAPENAQDEPADEQPTEPALPVSEAPSTIRWTAQGGMGPTVGFNGTAFGRLIMDGQYRLFGADVGPAVGPMLHVLFGRNRSGLQLGPIFVWELFLADPNNIRIYVGPLIATGYGMERYDDVIVTFRHYWYLTLGGQARAMFNDRIGAFVRPINFDISAGTGGAQAAWSFAAGVSLDF